MNTCTDHHSPAAHSKAKQQPLRTLDADGRVLDSVAIRPGEVFVTNTGNHTTPYPRQRHDKFASQWLIDNAVAEAHRRGDRMNIAVFSGERPLRSGELPPASVACMTLYLFG